MIEKVLQDIPRIHTAVAEWSACFMFVLLLKRQILDRKIIGISMLALCIQITFMVLTKNVSILFWVPCMVIAVLLMMAYLYIACNITKLEAAYLGIQAFVTAEFSASLEWQIATYFWGGNVAPYWFQLLFLILVVTFVNLVMWNIFNNYLSKESRLDITSRELFSVMVIAMAVFGISNLSFVTENTPFSAQYSIEVANIRTIVDLGGMAMLYAHLVQCVAIRVRRELEAVQGVLQNQYQQYKQSRESIDLINYKYHDLKHQIHLLRSSEDPEKRNAYLDMMEEDIKKYELQNKTGNHVLDTVLTSKMLYCDKHGITFTCVADGTLLDFMNTMDICSIFGNALDNAIECEKKIEDKEKRLIHVTVTRQKDFLVMRFENYFEGRLEYKEGTLVTTKSEKEFHGYGIKSIEYTVNRYDGAVSIDTKKNWFELKVLIPIRQKQPIV